MRKVFIHLHIPKCGGSSVIDFLGRNFGTRLGSTNSILNDYQYDSCQVGKIIDHFPDLQCLTGHKLSLDLPTDRDDLDITSFTWIRDPVDRFVSHYFYHRNHTTLVPEAKTLSLDEYIHWALVKGNQQMYIDGQSQFLAKGNLDLIRERVDGGSLMVFPLAKMQESFYTLSKLYPEYFTDWRLRERNISKKDQTIPEDIRIRLTPFVKNDMRLLEIANRTPLEKLPNGTAAWTTKGVGVQRKIASTLRKIASRLDRSSG